jgi:hypothetical protein
VCRLIDRSISSQKKKKKKLNPEAGGSNGPGKNEHQYLRTVDINFVFVQKAARTKPRGKQTLLTDE